MWDDWPLLVARVAFDASLLCLGGSLVFAGLVAPRAFERMAGDEVHRAGLSLRRWSWACLGGCLAGLPAWTMLQTAEMAGTNGLAALWGGLGLVLWRTSFGHVALLQAGLLALVTIGLATERRWSVAAALACLIAQAAHGHGAAMGGAWGPLFASSALHLLAAAVWVGGLVPLLLVLARSGPRGGLAAARWFSPVGQWAVAGLAGSAAVQGCWLVGSVRALTMTDYGWTVMVKVGLFVALLGLAVGNRYRWAPRLGRAEAAAGARRTLVASIAVQSLIGLAAVSAAGVLSGLVPGMDMGAGS